MDINSEEIDRVNILVLAIHGPYEPWLSILMNGQMPTWMSGFSPVRIINVFGRAISSKLLIFDQLVYFLRWNRNPVIAYLSLLVEATIKVLFFVSRYRPRVLERSCSDVGGVWEVQMPDSLMLQGVKNIAALRNSLEHEYDFLVTTISSTYLNLPALEDFLRQSNRNEFLGGRLAISGGKVYQQGSFRVFSRDVVEYLVDNSIKYRHWKIEDIAMGTLARRRFNSFVDIPNMSIDSLMRIETLDIESVRSCSSFRCKSVDENGDRNDSQIMLRLHNLIAERT